MKFIICTTFMLLSFSYATAARIRNHKVKEAPKSCQLMREDASLSCDNKRVLGTLRHSLVIENSEDSKSITLVKDKGEKLCQWSLEDWSSIQKANLLPELDQFKFHIDEYKEILHPYVKKADNSYFLMSIP
jgi:hypothetical protein